MNSILLHEYHSPIGTLLLGSYENKLCLCDWKDRKARETVDKRLKMFLKAEYKIGINDVISESIKQLDEYFNGNRRFFKTPLLLIGTEFQKTVWKTLMDISYGEIITYKKLSEKIDAPKAVRAIANAVGANPLSIIIPCHRIIGSDGGLTGYAGGIEAKKYLLDIEVKKTNQTMHISF